jgi:hypothetical protein
MPLLVVLMSAAQVPNGLRRLTFLGVRLGFLHGKDEGDVDEVLVDRMGMIGGEWDGFSGTGDG